MPRFRRSLEEPNHYDKDAESSEETDSSIEVVEQRYVGSPIASYLLQKTLDDGGSVFFMDEDIEIKKPVAVDSDHEMLSGV